MFRVFQRYFRIECFDNKLLSLLKERVYSKLSYIQLVYLHLLNAFISMF